MNAPSSARRVALILPDDPSAVSALIGAVDYITQRAGLPPDQRKHLAAAAEAAYHAAFRSLRDHNATIAVVVEEYPDRIDIILEHPGSRSSPPEESSQAFQNLDGIRHQTEGGASRTILTKYVR